ncbi:uncharacterized protein VTP21DRAFT_11116 [Calcarisporiella thermophila]|uniref:uncharacterized protein n=1 Tax=Calcarisporiella thermophila TaxID=911321 RepID=UPI00374484FD
MRSFNAHTFRVIEPIVNVKYKPTPWLDDPSSLGSTSFFLSDPLLPRDAHRHFQGMVTPDSPFNGGGELEISVSMDELRGENFEGMLLTFSAFSQCSVEMEIFEVDYLVYLKGKQVLAGEWKEEPEQKSFLFFKTQVPSKHDELISQGYVYFREGQGIGSSNPHILFLGSISETSGYTTFKSYLTHSRLTIMKDISGLMINAQKKQDLIQVLVLEGSERPAIMRYLQEFGGSPRTVGEHAIGWTSRNLGEKVNEKSIVETLEALSRQRFPMDYFMIDVGYQHAYGDWILIDPNRFPSGMAELVHRIKEFGYKAAIRISPLAVSSESRLFQLQPDWVVLNSSGSMVQTTSQHYLLDFYNPQFQDYLLSVFDTLLTQWKFDLVHVDLTDASPIARLGRSRAQILDEVVDFVRNAVGEHRLLMGSGAPLLTGVGKFHYWSIENGVKKSEGSAKEDTCRFSIELMRNLLQKWQLSGEAYGIEPGLISMTDSGLSLHEYHTHLLLSNLLGSLILTADPISEYTLTQHRALASIFPKARILLSNVYELWRDFWVIEYAIGQRRYTTHSNLSDTEVQFDLPGAVFEAFGDGSETVEESMQPVLYFRAATTFEGNGPEGDEPSLRKRYVLPGKPLFSSPIRPSLFFTCIARTPFLDQLGMFSRELRSPN